MSTRENESEYIKNLQRYLRVISATQPQIPPPPLDGIFDEATERSLRIYQELRGLPATGRADLETWNRVYADYLAALQLQAASEGFYLFPNGPLNYAVYPDEEHFLVLIIQYILNELGALYDDIPKNSQSGVYDEMTRQGVLAFQRRNGLSENDRVDRQTWNALVREHKRILTGEAT